MSTINVLTMDDEAIYGIRSLWLELTNFCNLKCIHCYNESGPHINRSLELTYADYSTILASASALNCKDVHFLGGEPTLEQRLPDLIAEASELGFTSIRLTTNGTMINDKLFGAIRKYKVKVAVSIHSHIAEIHDLITKRKGSHAKTVKNISRLVSDGISIKANVALHAENSEYFQETKEFLENIGVNIIHFDHVKKIGRVCNDTTTSELSELCGACWNGIICVAANGDVSPCAMSKKIKVGSIIKESLSDIVKSKLLALKRAEIKHTIWDKKKIDIKSPYDEVQTDNKPSPKDEPPKPYCYPTCQPSTHCLPD